MTGPQDSGRRSWVRRTCRTLARSLHVLRHQGWAELRRKVAARLAAPAENRRYRRWVADFDTLTLPGLAAIRAAIAQMPRRPLISVIMPVYEPPEAWLRAAIASVRDQLYPDWELCIADDASPSPHVRALLSEVQQQDARIKVVLREHNGHIAAASNSAVELAGGEFLALLDHDDILPPHALYLVADAILRWPDADLFYSDEDKLDTDGARYQPYFKPALSPELFYGQNMISHLGTYRTAVVREVGGFREGLEGSQDYDLALRVMEHSRPERIRHLPHILYHWRAGSGSTARDVATKEYAVTAARRALADHFRRTGKAGQVEAHPRLPQYQRIRYQLPDPPPAVHIVTESRVPGRAPHHLNRLRRHTSYPDWSLKEVDPSRRNRAGLEGDPGEILCFLHPALEPLNSGWLEELVGLACQPGVGPVGAKIVHRDDTLHHVGVILGLGGGAGFPWHGLPRHHTGTFGRAALTQALSAVSGGCLLIRRALFQQVGGFDEAYCGPLGDVDLCLRLKDAGFRAVWTPFAELRLNDGGDDCELPERYPRETARFRARWGEALTWDPYYHPHLALDGPAFKQAHPPRQPALWEF